MFKETSRFKRLFPKILPGFWNKIAHQYPDRAQIRPLESFALAKHDLVENELKILTRSVVNSLVQ